MLEELPPLSFPLVNRFFRENGHKGKARSNERVFLWREEGEILAALRACPRSSGYLLRSVWVAIPHRGKGLGTKLLRDTLIKLESNCWCYAYDHLRVFYEKLGFKQLSSKEVPDDISIPFERYMSRGERLVLMNTIPSSHTDPPLTEKTKQPGKESRYLSLGKFNRRIRHREYQCDLHTWLSRGSVRTGADTRQNLYLLYIEYRDGSGASRYIEKHFDKLEHGLAFQREKADSVTLPDISPDITRSRPIAA